ncbi:hypothetical protein AQ490_01530 [Wenjunlia vitaminophila]|uniref:Secreted protein n=1 Tax=Wenjunlia vitaminophila TaxID=76728 RepID=A0A0T6LZK4_WENVI|nr:hypothetical protein [Wenjunlia vitaminophila]KRV51464.1 hypothetical protein AQ490_01530 [Wenjunlia vitaminophila]
MSSIRRLAAVCGVVTALLVATACGPEDDSAGSDTSGGASASKDAKEDFKLPDGLPTTLDQLKDWRWDDWEGWAKEAAQDAFKNPLVKDLWDAARMQQAVPLDMEFDLKDGGGDGQDTTDPVPDPVEAQRVETPYTDHAAPIGKIFFDTPDSPAVCSGTVIKDPAHPGKSNLVWTAGHCVHGGTEGGWYRNIQFVPAYNNKGQDPINNEVTEDDLSPYGAYWAEWVQTSDQWIEQGASTGGAGASYDYAVLKVVPVNGSNKSLEETVGNALPVWFDAPWDSLRKGVTAYGYPAAPPFDGQIMHRCDDTGTKLSLDESAPTMVRIGCTMTGGSSGGGWVTLGEDGKPALVSNTSIGPNDNTWLAGPYLGEVAQGVYQEISDKFADS